MSDFIFHVNALATCPHQTGQISTIVSNPRVTVSKQAVATLSDRYLIAGCAFVVALKPQPCLMVQWLKVATRVKVNGKLVVLKSSQGLCKSAEEIPQGPPGIKVTQLRAKGM